MELLADRVVAGGGVAEDTNEALGSCLALLMDELAHGVVVMGICGHLLYANEAARRELARHRVLTLRGDTVHAAGEDNAWLLKDALSKASDGRRSLLTLSAEAGPALTLAVVPLKAEGPSLSPRAALVFARASVCESLMLRFFARAHGLTPTEEQVLGILCNGPSAPEIASQMGVAVSTIRSHVRSLCAKTRSSGVRELVNRVAVLPPVAPPIWHEPMH
ncbi:MAG: helix-turn-helix transcriptional regulator [Ramlibacter sp.]